MKAPYLLIFPMLITTSVQIHAAENCNNLKTQIEMNVCSAEEYQREDAKLNKNYKELIGKLGPSERKKLKVVQLSWIKFRDLQCEFEASRYQGCSMLLN